jgi:hypothetical protein
MPAYEVDTDNPPPVTDLARGDALAAESKEDCGKALAVTGFAVSPSRSR